MRPSEAALATHTQLGCPDLLRTGGTDASVGVGLAAVPGLPGGGSVEAERRVDLARGDLEQVSAAGGPSVRAAGPAAAGLFAFRTGRTGGSAGSGARTLAVAPCPAPRARWWFTGAGAGLDHAGTLLVTNLDPGPAVVDLRVLGPDGEVDTVGTRGIVVAPRSVKRIPLADIAPQTDELALEVHAQRGRVVAAVTDRLRAEPVADPGRDWVPGTEQPSRTLWLAGLPAARPGRSEHGFGRTLVVANPTDLEAVVTVSVSGRSGAFVPTGVGETTVGPGGVRTVDLGDALSSTDPVAVRLSSTEPVVASVRSTRGGDQAYAGAVEALTGPAAAPLVRGTRASLQLTAGGAAARVQVEAYDGRGHLLEGRTLRVAPTATAVWSPATTTGYLLVTPLHGSGGGNGGVRGAVSYVGGGVAAVPLTALPLRETRPRVEPGLR